MALPEEQQAQLMAYLDGELAPQERQAFERVLMESRPLQGELAQLQRLQSIVQRVRIPEPKPELWDEQPRLKSEKLWRVVGWVLFLAGTLMVALTSELLLWSTKNIPCSLKLGITFIVLGLGALLASVLLRRCKESKTDRYREIVR